MGLEIGFDTYVDALASVMGHADRAGPFRDYCIGLVLPGGKDGTGAGLSAASVVAALCRRWGLVG